MSCFVIGHRNPDTDAIAAAIGYADFLQRTTLPEAVAARCGELSARTAFVLERAGIEPPRLVMDVRPTIGSICQRTVIGATVEDSLFEAFDIMRRRGLRGIPVRDTSGRIVGMISLPKLVELLLPSSATLEEARVVDSNLTMITKVLGGSMPNAVDPGREEALTVTVAAFSTESFAERLQHYNPQSVLLVVGDRPSIQTRAIEYGVRGLIISGQHTLSDDLLELARQKGVSVITSPHDTATTTLLIKCAKRITLALTTDFSSFPETALVKDIRREVQDLSQVLFPVLNEDNQLVGVFSKSDLLSPPATRLILVDHNEITQAVAGADEADIIEVVDHHRLGGGLSTLQPIRFINEPVGSTSTIISRFYRQVGMTPERPIALCLAAGMISDTLQLTSPTTTPLEHEMLPWLAKAAGIDVDAFSRDFFAAGSVLLVQSAPDIIQTDCKAYEENDWKFSVSQIEELGLNDFWKRQEDLLQALEAHRVAQHLDFATLLITDITRHYSLLLATGDRSLLALIDYPRQSSHLFELDGIVSRKKQLLPHLMWLLGKRPKN